MSKKIGENNGKIGGGGGVGKGVKSRRKKSGMLKPTYSSKTVAVCSGNTSKHAWKRRSTATMVRQRFVQYVPL